jgi:valyl-tRNA synthetase
MVNVVTDDARMFMPLSELVDLDAERERIKKELEKAEKDLENQRRKLSNEAFVSKAPEHVVNASGSARPNLRRSWRIWKKPADLA